MFCSLFPVEKTQNSEHKAGWSQPVCENTNCLWAARKDKVSWGRERPQWAVWLDKEYEAVCFDIKKCIISTYIIQMSSVSILHKLHTHRRKDDPNKFLGIIKFSFQHFRNPVISVWTWMGTLQTGTSQKDFCIPLWFQFATMLTTTDQTVPSRVHISV